MTDAVYSLSRGDARASFLTGQVMAADEASLLVDDRLSRSEVRTLATRLMATVITAQTDLVLVSPPPLEDETWRIIGTSLDYISIEYIKLNGLDGGLEAASNAQASSLYDATIHAAALAFTPPVDRWKSEEAAGEHWLQWESAPLSSLEISWYGAHGWTEGAVLQRLASDGVTWIDVATIDQGQTLVDASSVVVPPPPVLWRLTLPKTVTTDPVAYYRIEPFDGDPASGGQSLAAVSGLEHFALSSGATGGVQALNGVTWSTDPGAGLSAEWIEWDGPEPAFLEIHRHESSTDDGLVTLERSDDNGTVWHVVDSWYIGSEWPNSSAIVAINAETAVPLPTGVRTWRIFGPASRGVAIWDGTLWTGPDGTGSQVSADNVEVSSIYSSSYLGEYAFDNLGNTRWTTTLTSGDHWIKWDSEAFASIDLRFYSASYDWEGAMLQILEEDGVTWTDVVAIPEGTPVQVNTGASLPSVVSPLPEGVALWRLYAPQGDADVAMMGEYTLQIRELDLFEGSDDSGAEVIPTEPTGSSEFSASYLSEFAIDNDNASFFSSARIGKVDHWFQWTSDSFGYIRVKPWAQNRMTIPTRLERLADDGVTWEVICELNDDHWISASATFERTVP